MKKHHFPQSILIFLAMALSFYNTDGPANWVIFDKDISPDTCLRNLKEFCTYFIDVDGNGSLLYLKNKNYIHKGKLYVPVITNSRSKIGMRLVTSDHKPNPKRDHFPADG